MASLVNGVFYSGDTSGYTNYLDNQDLLYRNEGYEAETLPYSGNGEESVTVLSATPVDFGWEAPGAGYGNIGGGGEESFELGLDETIDTEMDYLGGRSEFDDPDRFQFEDDDWNSEIWTDPSDWEVPMPDDDKPWFDYIIPGDQDTPDDLVPLHDEDASGWWDAVTPGDSDSPGEAIEDMGVKVDINSLIPLIVVMSIFD